MDTERIGQEILAFLKGQEAPVEMAIIQEELNVNRKRLSDALKALYDDGKIERSGAGKKGNPYRYFVDENAVPTTAENGTDPERCREQHLPNNSNGIDLENNTVPPFPAYKREQKERNNLTMADHVAGLTGPARDEAAEQLVLGRSH